MGYLKSGSSKSLAAGVGSAAVLVYVYSQLPTNPVLASSVGLGKGFFLSCLSVRALPSSSKSRVLDLSASELRTRPIDCTVQQELKPLLRICRGFCRFADRNGVPFQEFGEGDAGGCSRFPIPNHVWWLCARNSPQQSPLLIQVQQVSSFCSERFGILRLRSTL